LSPCLIEGCTKENIAMGYCAMHYMRIIRAKKLGIEPNLTNERIVQDKWGNKNPNWKGGMRNRGDGYIIVLNPNHPRAMDGYVKRAVLVAEKAVGHILPTKVIVHHVDQDRSNDANNNLVICENQAYHLLIQRRMDALKASGYAHFKKCVFCKKYDDPKSLVILKRGNGKISVYHKICKQKIDRIFWHKKQDIG
jgi:hypothetical protein